MEVSLKDGAFRGNYNKPFESLFFIFFLMINFLIIFSIQRKINPFIDNLFGSLILLIFALNIFFFLHLVLPMGIYKNYEYLLLNFKLFFLSEVNIEATMNVLSSLNPSLLLKSMPVIYENFLWNISKHYFQYFSLFCLFILIYFNYLKNNIKIQKFTKYVLIISFFLLIIHILKFTRAGAWNHRDGIYNEYIIFMFIVLSIYLSLDFCKKKIFHLIFLYSYLLLTSLLSILNLNYLNQKDSNQNYSFYQNLKKPVGGENISKFMKDDKIDPYSNKRNVNITKTALNFYDTKEERLQHFKQASNYNKIKIILKNSHDNYINNVDLKSVGIIEKSSKLKLHDRKIEIVKFTNGLENNFIVNFKNLKNEKYYFANMKLGYKQIIFYDQRKHNRENLPCYQKEEKSILTIKDNGVLIDLFSYTPIFQCNFLTKNFDKNLYYTFIRLY